MISFAAPWMLAALAAVAIPLILHLVARREPPLQSFPAVRYLEDTARRHQRRFRLQHWLLLLVRMALITALVLAAAGPSRAGGGPGGHAPAALVLIVDNSLSSGAIRGGTPVLEELREAALQLLARAGAGDQLWLILADGMPVGGSADALRAAVGAAEAQPFRLDLGAAVVTAHQLLAGSPLPGEVVVLTDLQATAITAADGVAVLVGVPEGDPPRNLGIAAIETGPQPWIGTGRITITASGPPDHEGAATVRMIGRPLRQLVMAGGSSVSVPLAGLPAGWHPVAVELDPDELRQDDVAWTGIRVAPPVRVGCPADGSHLAAACEVLRENGRVLPGLDVALDRLGTGPSVVLPPADPAGLGALNRALAARGVGWSFGEMVVTTSRSDSSSLLAPHEVVRRHRLIRSGTATSGVLLTVSGEPWLVRSGGVLLLGSRLDPDWTGLPLAAGFMPFMDLLLNRLVRGEAARLTAAPGDPVLLPDRATGVVTADGVERVEGGAAWTGTATGLHWLLAGADTIGVLEVNPDPRESALARIEPAALAGLWPGVRVETPAGAAGLAFTLTARADLRVPLLWLAAALALAELFLAGFLRRRA